MPKRVINGVIRNVTVEDGGAALIANVEEDDNDLGTFVRIQSWDDRGPDEKDLHSDFKALVGTTKRGRVAPPRKVRVTIEVVA
jgi:hypothetical protein